MSIIYQPGEVFNLADEFQGGFISAILTAAIDFIAGDNKPWAYYLGIGLGTMAAATGIPGATATLYVVGDSVDALFLKSPDGSDVRIFLNGVAHSTLDTYAASVVWEGLNINGLVGGQVNRLDIVNYGPSLNANASGVMWLGLGPITVNGSSAYAQKGVSLMPVPAFNTLAFRLQDSESDTEFATMPVYVPPGLLLADYQGYSDYWAPLINAATGAKITEALITVKLTLPAGLKATPNAGSLNERGGLIGMDTDGPHADSFRIPAILPTIMPGGSFVMTDTAIAAIITALNTAHNVAGVNIKPLTKDGFAFVGAGLYGKKSFRK